MTVKSTSDGPWEAWLVQPDGGYRLFVNRSDCCGVLLDRMLASHVRPGARTHQCRMVGACRKPLDRDGEVCRVARLDEEACLAVDDDFGDAAESAPDDGDAGCKCLED